MHIAIIDLGTNTFNLLIAQCRENADPLIVHRSKYASKIGKGGFTDQQLTQEAMDRGLNALRQMMPLLKRYRVNHTTAFATSAFRSAKNGYEFVRKIQHTFGFSVNIITGEQEAELIYQGTKRALSLNNEKVAILDIGGGSNEIIIADGQQIYWKKSFPLGITRLLEQFTPSDPISTQEALEIEDYLRDQLLELFEENKIYQIKTLIGSSGSFNTFKQILQAKNDSIPVEESSFFEIKLKEFLLLHRQIMDSSLEGRMAIPGMDPARVDLMPLASLFIHIIIKQMGINKLFQSSFALKEGALYSYIPSL